MSSQTPFGRRGLGTTASAPAPFYNAAPKPPAPTAAEPSPILALLFGFQGRIPRLQYWMGQVGVIVVSRVVVFMTAGLKSRLVGVQAAGAALVLAAALLAFAVLVLLIWISLAIVVKRWHDRGKSGYWALLGLIPIFGWTWQGVECGFLEGTLGPNRFGPSPKGITGVTYGTPEADTFA